MLGLSVGRAPALRPASRLGETAGPLPFSTAGPLDLASAFAGMGAGAKMFCTARDRPRAFGAAVRLQALTAAGAPGVLRRLLFAGAEPSDRNFAVSPAARAVLTRAFRQAWTASGAGYRRDLATTADPWSPELARVPALIVLWHQRADT